MATTAQNTVANTVSGGQNLGGNYIPGWEAGVLGLIGAQPTKANIQFLQNWHQADESAATNNPLNVGKPAPGGPPYLVGSGTLSGNPNGIQIFPTPYQGMEATAYWIGDYSNYSAIKDALMSGNPQAWSQKNNQNFSALDSALSKWSGGGYGASKILYGITPSPATPSGPSSPGHISGSTGTPGGGLIGNPALPIFGAAGGVASGAASAATSAYNDVTSVGNFLGLLSNPNFWLRFLQITAGMAAVGLGIYLLGVEVVGGNFGKSIQLDPDSRVEKARRKAQKLELDVRVESAQNRRQESQNRLQVSQVRTQTYGTVAGQRVAQARAKTRESRANARTAEANVPKKPAKPSVVRVPDRRTRAAFSEAEFIE